MQVCNEDEFKTNKVYLFLKASSQSDGSLEDVPDSDQEGESEEVIHICF